MKNKILSFLLSICIVLTSAFSLVSCSLVKVDNTKKNNETIIKIAGTNLSRSDVVSAFYTYYQNNGSYFAYYDESVIENSFYQWAIVRQMLNDLSSAALYDAETNPNGYIYYTKEDSETVWDNVKSYIYSQVSSYEKTKYSLENYKEENYPSWLKSDEEETETENFTPYTKVEYEFSTQNVSDENPIVNKLSKEEVVSMVSALKEYLFEYVSETDNEGNEVRATIDETNYIIGARNWAYAKYIESLVSNAKSAGTSTNEEECLNEEIYRIYEAYYNSRVTANFQKYYLNEYLSNNVPAGKTGDSEALADKLIVKAFLEEYYTQKQLFSSEKGYIEKITNSDGAPLILYSYNGQNYFFSVQHILIKFTDYLNTKVKELEGYPTSSYDYDAHTSEVYKANRDNLANEYATAILGEVNENTGLNSIHVEGSYYYYDETQKDVYDETTGVLYGYVKVSKTEIEEEGNTVTSYVDMQGNSYSGDDVKFMANIFDVYTAYNQTFAEWKTIVESYYNGTLTRENAISEHEDMEYIFDTVDNMKSANYSLTEIEEKIASYLFLELEWIYSSDSLKNELSNKIGYIISNYDDENGSWVADFANGSRELAKKLEEESINIDEVIASNNVSDLTYTVVSDYGFHIIKVENVYKTGDSVSNLASIIDELTNAGKKISYEDEEVVSRLTEFLKANYVANASNETLYDYFYDIIYTDYVGDSSSSGTYFVDLEYKWLNEFYENGEVEIVKKLSYTELMAAIQ